ncbi:MAG TPA: hypothetical protein VEX86_06740 [Longimicrobium sp.]|nr:hypothetical protein [Longimicrobium sp.]
MALAAIPRPELIRTAAISPDPVYQGLRIVRCQTDEMAEKHYSNNRYEFQHLPADYTPVTAVLCHKGAVGQMFGERGRVVAMLHPNLKMFTQLIQYDPSNPPRENYAALEMTRAHDQTQSDFKGQKAANKDDFKNYILEGIWGNRTLFLPVITGWQSRTVFERTVFVAFDEGDANAMYGMLYLPKAPVMQADGQTQTAALFAVADSRDAVDAGALENLLVTVEIELNVDERKAGQSFADRNGRGSKKNRNLVIGFDTL